MRGNDQTTLILTSCVGNPAEAAFLLRSNGSPREALDLLRREKSLSPDGKIEAFRAAKALGEKPDPSWEEAARKAVSAFESACDSSGRLSSENATICGAPLDAVEDLARVKLARERVLPGGELPVFLPRGTYGVQVLLAGTDVASMAHWPLFNVPMEDLEVTRLENGDLLFDGKLELAAGTRLRFAEAFPKEAIAKYWDWGCRRLEITWDPARLVADEIEEIRAELGN